MRRRFFCVAPVALIASLVVLHAAASRGLAWSHKEHMQLTRLAAMRIVNDPAAPEAMKQWLRANVTLLGSMDEEREAFLHASVGEEPLHTKPTGLSLWAVVPDLEAARRDTATNGPFGRHERLSHYVDLELFNRDPNRRRYRLDLSGLPAIDDLPRDVNDERYVKAGYLPFVREHAYRRLVDCLKAGRLAADPATPDDPQQPERADHAVRWAGYLAHYTQDNTQPQHATVDYKSGRYFAAMRNPPNVHSEMEYRMADDATQPLPGLRADFWPLFAEELTRIDDVPPPNPDVFLATLETSLASYRALPLIGEAASETWVQQQAGAIPADANQGIEPRENLLQTSRPATRSTTRGAGGSRAPTLNTEYFFRFAGSIDGKPTTVMQIKARQLALAVVNVDRVWRQAWDEAYPASPK